MTPSAVRRLVRILQAAPDMGIVQHLTVARRLPWPFRGCSSSACARACASGQPVRPGGRATRGRIGVTTPSCASPRSAPIAAWHRCPTAARSCRTTRSRRPGCGPPAGACASGRRSGDRRRRIRPPCRNSFIAMPAGWRAICNTAPAALPGFRPMGRWQLLQAILLFAGAPLYTAMLALAAVSAATGGGLDFPRNRMLAMTAA